MRVLIEVDITGGETCKYKAIFPDVFLLVLASRSIIDKIITSLKVSALFVTILKRLSSKRRD
jgi:hypothetical protein